jgi:hypothetical protein
MMNGCRVHMSIMRRYNVWWSYINAHMNDHLGKALYCEGLHGVLMTSMVGGYCVVNGEYNVVGEGLPSEVIVFGWDQQEVDASVASAISRGLTPVTTVRISDNVHQDL